MSPRKDHEKIKTLLGRLVIAFAEEQEIEIESVASTTFRRHDLDRGFEADESFYIEHAEAIRAKDEIDLSIDPPPELIIEVEITSPAIRKMELFAAIGIPEVWRHNGRQLSVSLLNGDQYDSSQASRGLPDFPIAVADSIVAQRKVRSEIELVREFRVAIRENS